MSKKMIDGKNSRDKLKLKLKLKPQRPISDVFDYLFSKF
jgi:hypothetical protein